MELIFEANTCFYSFPGQNNKTNLKNEEKDIVYNF